MGLSTREQFSYWGAAAAAVVLLMWAMGYALMPFLLGAAIAYFLDPIADWLERHKFSRLAATALVMAVMVLILAITMLLILPILAEQLRDLITSAPGLISQTQIALEERYPGIFDADSSLRRAAVAMQDSLKTGASLLVESILSSSLVLIDIFVVLILAPVIGFYLLLDWDRMISKADDLIPREHLETVHHLARQVDAVLSGFVRGQLSVCAILGLFYAIALAVVGLNFGILVGAIAGLLTFIPFVGSVLGGILAIGLAVVQFWDAPVWIGVVAAIFIFGQIVEGNVLTPNLVGGSVGLHPVWLMFALSAFGAFFGFTGLLVAVPAAAVIGVLTRHALEEYRTGRLYLGRTSDNEAAE
ncbi:AI-2E family transporter [Halovulum sp. GXIMD14793]